MTPRPGPGHIEAMNQQAGAFVANVLLVMAGGGAGAASRYLLSAALTRAFGSGFGWGTAAANLAGCFVIGIAAGHAERLLVPRQLWLFAVTGFLGGLTTFSTFSMEVVSSLRAGSARVALATLALSVLGGFAATVAGMAIVLGKR